MNDLEAPAMMRAAVLNEYVGGAGLVVQDVPRPVPEAGEVLIEVAATPINPSDLAYLEGNYSPRPTLPTRAGSLVLAACSGAEDGGSDSTVGVSPGSAMGPGISIEDALTADAGQPRLVNGFLFVDEEGTRGNDPRRFSFDPGGRFLYCGNQRADNVAVFKVVGKTGRLKFSGQYVPVGNPSHIVFVDLAK